MVKDDDPWECLDVDDSDLKDLFRLSENLLPAKRPSSPLHANLSVSLSTNHLPSLEPCSQRIRSSNFLLGLRQSCQNASQFPEKAVISGKKSAQNAESERSGGLPKSDGVLCRLRIPDRDQFSKPIDGESFRNDESDPLDSENPEEIEEIEGIRVVRQSNDLENRLMVRSRIPGPAGDVQLAMQKEGDVSGDRSWPSDGTLELMDCREDEDFKKNPWLCAMDFIQKQNSELGERDRSPFVSIKSIKSMVRNVERLPQVMGIIKSCMPDALGHLVVTLKDPTGIIEASIHHKVLEEDKFGKEISVGSVLILRQVVVFSPRRSSWYLNITLNNVFKVINKDCTLARVDSSLRVSTNDTRASQDVRMTLDAQSNPQAHTHEEGSNVLPETVTVDKSRSTADLPHEPSEVCRKSEGCSNAASRNSGSGLPVNCGTERSLEVKRLISGTSLGDWTDEQINELFSSCEDMF